MKLIELGSILHMVKGKKPLHQSEQNHEGYRPYVDIKAFETGVVSAYTDGEKCLPCNDGDVLIVCDGARSGLVGRAIKGYVGSTLALLHADGLLNDYLFYFVQGKYRLLNTKMKGTGTPHLNAEELKKQKLVVPSLAEQQRIVAKIEELFSELDNSVAALKQTKAQLSVYRQAVLKDAFSNITSTKSIQQSSVLVTSGSRGWAQYYSSEGARFVRITDLTRDSISLKNNNIQHVTIPQNAEGTRSKLLSQDILVSITADLGSIALIPDNIGDAFINQHIALVRLKNSKLAKCIAWYLRSDLGQKSLLKNKRGGGKLGLGLDDIRCTDIPDISEKEATNILRYIESRLSTCDNVEKTINAALQQAESLRQSILKQAFEGKLV